jgi:prophage regulatory protein
METKIDSYSGPDRFLRRREILALTGIPQSTLYQMMAKGTFPKNERITPRLVGWRESAIASWMASRKHKRFAVV